MDFKASSGSLGSMWDQDPSFFGTNQVSRYTFPFQHHVLEMESVLCEFLSSPHRALPWVPYRDGLCWVLSCLSAFGSCRSRPGWRNCRASSQVIFVQGDLNSRTVFDFHEVGSQAKDVLLEAVGGEEGWRPVAERKGDSKYSSSSLKGFRDFFGRCAWHVWSSVWRSSRTPR